MTLIVGTALADTLVGGGDGDSISGGAGNDSLNGGAGADTLAGGLGRDSLWGGDGADLFEFAPGDSTAKELSSDIIFDWSSSDRISALGLSATPDQYVETNGFDFLGAVSVASSFIGLSGKKIVVVTTGVDLIVVFGTNDGKVADAFTIVGRSLADIAAANFGIAVALPPGQTINGGNGSELLSGGDGSDTISGGGGDDSLSGGLGADALAGGSGHDILYGGGDADTFVFGLGDSTPSTARADQIWDWSSDDRISLPGVVATYEQYAEMLGFDDIDALRLGSNAIAAGMKIVVSTTNGGLFVMVAANDGLTVGDAFKIVGRNLDAISASNFGIAEPSPHRTLIGTAASEGLSGGTGNDTLSGLDGNDNLAGMDGNDSLMGGAGADTLYGWDGIDQLSGGRGADTFLFAVGHSRWTGPSDVIHDWSAADTISFITISLTREQYFEGSADNSSDARSVAASAMFNRGMKIVVVEVGSDLLVFADSFGHGSFDDTIKIVGRSLADISAANFDLLTSAHESIASAPGGVETHGADGNDTINGGAFYSVLRGDEGDDYIMGGSGFDDSHGNMGDDTVRGGDGDDWVVGGKDQDELFGDAGGDIVLGNLGDDTCEGGAGDDVVRGGQGGDIVLGGEGADWLSGDRGNDTITGGAGADLFHSFGEAGLDRVTDFNYIEGDRVNLLAGSTYSLVQVGADTVITIDGSAQMTLVGVTLSSLPSGWIAVG